MLVSAAMAERPRATASGRSRPAPAAQAPAGRHSTARVATTQGVRRSELPGWFWGALGCLTVLVVGLTIVFVMGQPGVASAPTSDMVPAVIPTPPAQAAAAPGAASRAPEAQRARAAGIQVEPMAAPPPAIEQAAPAPVVVVKPKVPARPLKVARSPAAAKAKPAGASKPAADEEEGEDEPKAKPRAAAPAAADESEEK